MHREKFKFFTFSSLLTYLLVFVLWSMDFISATKTLLLSFMLSKCSSEDALITRFLWYTTEFLKILLYFREAYCEFPCFPRFTENKALIYLIMNIQAFYILTVLIFLSFLRRDIHFSFPNSIYFPYFSSQFPWHILPPLARSPIE